MNTRILKILLPFLCILFLVAPAMATTYGDATIISDRTGLEISYDGHTYIFWHIEERDTDGNRLIQYTIRQAKLTKETTRTIDGTEFYELEYNGIVNIIIENTGESLIFTFEDRVQQKYADSTFVLVYAIDGVAYELEFSQLRVGVCGATLTIDKVVDNPTFFEQVKEWFENLF